MNENEFLRALPLADRLRIAAVPSTPTLGDSLGLSPRVGARAPRSSHRRPLLKTRPPGRASIGEVKALARSSRPIGIPLAAIPPFRVDGEQLGNVRRVELLRTSPHEISGFRLIVRLRDSTGSTQLGDCTLTINDPDSFAT